VLDASVRRSRERGARTGAFADGTVARAARAVDRLRPALDRIAPTPFLDDATTKNVIVHDGRLTGIVDLDWIGAGDPALAPALTKVSLTAAGRATRYADLLLDAMGGRRGRCSTSTRRSSAWTC